MPRSSLSVSTSFAAALAIGALVKCSSPVGSGGHANRNSCTNTGETLTLNLGGGVSMELVLVPSGTLMMGSDKGNEDEKPVHKVTFAEPFYIGKHEVTQEQWQAVMHGNPSWFTVSKSLPVDSVS